MGAVQVSLVTLPFLGLCMSFAFRPSELLSIDGRLTLLFGAPIRFSELPEVYDFC